MSTGEKSAYNLTQLSDMYGGNQDNVKKTVEIFCDQLAQDIIMLRQKFEESNLTSVKDFAHRMKPNLKLFGVMDMHNLVVLIEASSLAGDKDALGPQLEELYSRSKALMALMKKEVLEA